MGNSCGVVRGNSDRSAVTTDMRMSRVVDGWMVHHAPCRMQQVGRDGWVGSEETHLNAAAGMQKRWK